MASKTPAPPSLDQVDFSQIQVLAPRPNKNAPGQTSYIRYNGSGSGKFIVTLKNALIQYALRPFKDKKTGEVQKKLTLNIALEEDEEGNLTNPELKKFLEKLQDTVVKQITANASTWGLPSNVGKKFNDIIKTHINKETKERYNDTWQIRVQMDPETLQIRSKFFDGRKKNEPIPITFTTADQEIPMFTRANMYVHISKVWYSGNGVGVTADLIQGSFNRPEGMITLPEIEVCDDDLAERETKKTDEFGDDDDDEVIVETTDDLEELKVGEDDVEEEPPKKPKGKGRRKN